MEHQRHFLLTYPRTASNLLMRILNLDAQPNVLSGEYFFLPILQWKFGGPGLAGRHMSTWSNDETTGLMRAYEQSFSDLETHIRTAGGEGKNVFVKEHVPWMVEPTAEMRFVYEEDDKASGKETAWMVRNSDGSSGSRSKLNETVLPDEFLALWKPTFLIRHPALTFPSLYRVGKKNISGSEVPPVPSEVTIRWSRVLFDWYRENLGTEDHGDHGAWPIVLDADDIMTSPSLVQRYADIIGLEPDALVFHWDAATKAELNAMSGLEKKMVATLHSSSGVMGGKTAEGLDISIEAAKWREEFGQEAGEKIEKWVRDAVGDYEYLRGKRLQA